MATEKKEKSLGYVSKTRLATMFGITSRRVEQLVSDGIIESSKGHNGRTQFDLEDTIRQYIKYLTDKANGRKNAVTEIELKEQKLRAEIALKESQSELHRLRTDIALGNYIPIEEVKAEYSRFFIIFKNFALGLAAKTVGKVSLKLKPVEARELEKEIEKEIEEKLNEFVLSAVSKSEKQAAEDVITPKKRGRPPKKQ